MRVLPLSNICVQTYVWNELDERIVMAGSDEIETGIRDVRHGNWKCLNRERQSKPNRLLFKPKYTDAENEIKEHK